MDIKKALEKLAETLTQAAQFAKDKGATTYTAEMHASACGLAMRVIFHPKQGEALEPTNANYAAVFHAAYNHSAWRQKFEKAKLFPKKEERTFGGLMAELEEEGIGEA